MKRRTVRTSLAPTRTERRDPTAATVQLQYAGLGVPQTNRHNAARATANALKAWVVMRCIQIKAQDLAGIPFVAGARLPTSYTELPETNPNARLARLVGQTPAPKTSAPVWWEWMLTQRYITGQMAAEIDWAGTPTTGEVAALWPLTASALKAVPTDGGVEWWKRFEYGRPDKPRTLAVDRVFYGWDPAPDDFRQPWSILASAQIDVDVAVQVGRYNAAFLRNDARPAAVVVTEQFATEDDFDQFVNQFEGRHQGVDNAGKLAFVETDPDGATPNQAISIQTLGISQKDARMMEMHRASLEHVAMALGVPWSRLSAADRTFSNAGQESVDYWKGLASDARKFGAEVNACLAPVLGPEVGWFDLSGVEALAPRPPVSAQEAVALVNGFIATPEEVRPWYGLAGPGPDMPALPEVPAPPAPPVAADEDPESTRSLPPVQIVVDGAAIAEASFRRNREAEVRALTAEEQEIRRTTIWRRNDAALRGLITAYEKRWAALFNRQAAAVVAQVTGKRTAARLAAASQARELRADLGIGGPLDPNEIARWRAQALDLADLMHTAATTTGVTRVNNAFGVSFDLEAPFVQDFIGARANQLAGQVTDSTYAAIQQALQDGVANGASIDDLASAVQDVFDVASTSRAKTIARTEVISASNGSASLAAAQLPSDVAAGQEFIATRDERVRDDHADADGQIVAMGAPFDVGGESLLYPGDPAGSAENVINCRCTVAFLTPQDMERAGRSRVVPLRTARALLRMVPAGEFDEAAFRSALQEAAA
ncbi:MAG: phage portal protein [Acidimicrobiales bacterium]|nr:phage portal protein [Acidimicrobiales bacterium]